MRLERRLLIVVTAAIAAQANARAAEIDTGGAGGRTFTVGLSPTGLPPATHYWCSWAMSPAVDAEVREKLRNAVEAGTARVFNGNLRDPESVLAELGLKRLGEVA